MAYLERPDARIFYEHSGSGQPPIVLVHGFACEHADWHAQVERFRSRHVVVTLDLRGHGRSRESASGFDIVTYGADLIGLLDVLALEPAVLVGHSMGCRVVLEAAHLAPRAVAGVVLVDGSRQGSGDPESAARGVREAIAVGGLQDLVSGLFAGMFLASSDAGMKRRIMARAAALPEAVGSELFPSMVRWDAARLTVTLEALRAPLLVLQSTSVDEQRVRRPLSAGATSPWLDLLRHNVPGARIEVLPGIGHFTMLEAPEAVNDYMESFMDGLGVSA